MCKVLPTPCTQQGRVTSLAVGDAASAWLCPLPCVVRGNARCSCRSQRFSPFVFIKFFATIVRHVVASQVTSMSHETAPPNPHESPAASPPPTAVPVSAATSSRDDEPFASLCHRVHNAAVNAAVAAIQEAADESCARLVRRFETVFPFCHLMTSATGV